MGGLVGGGCVGGGSVGFLVGRGVWVGSGSLAGLDVRVGALVADGVRVWSRRTVVGVGVGDAVWVG